VTTEGTPRVERAPLFVESWEGVLAVIKKMYSAQSKIIGPKDIQVIPVANPDALERMILQQEKPLALPVIGVSIMQVEPNTGSFNPTAMRQHGYPMQVDDTRDYWIMAKVAPVLMTFQATFLTDDILTMLRMIDRWMSTENLAFTLATESTKLSFKIKLTMDKTVTVPTPAPGAGGSDQFKLTTNLKVEAYSGFLWRCPSIRVIEHTVNILKPNIKVTEQNFLEVIANPENGIVVAEQNFTKVVNEPEY